MRTKVQLEEAQAMLLEKAQAGREGYVSLFEAVGRVLSKDIEANVNLPPFNKSPLDGYAVNAKGTEHASQSEPAQLTVSEEIRAGFVPTQEVTPGTAIKVMTGAPIPKGANAVIRYEDVQREGSLVKIFWPLKADSNIIIAGEDVAKGEKLAKRGDLLTPALVGLLAGTGIYEVPVFEKVKIAIASTGDELAEPGAALLPGKIYNSNLYALHAFCTKLGAHPIALENLPDEREVTAKRIFQALDKADLVITTGGVSVGDYDVVMDALKLMGAKIIFWQVNMKPGSPVVAAEFNNKLIIGLSGNPAAAFITFELLVVPVIRQMLGLGRKLPVHKTAVLTEDFTKASPQRRFIRGLVSGQNGINYIKLTGAQSNGVLKSLVNCNALIDVPAGSGPLAAGQHVSILMTE